MPSPGRAPHWVLVLLAFAGYRCLGDSAVSIPPEFADRPLYTFSEEEVGEFLPIARQAWPKVTDRVVALGRKNLGQPYDLYLLGEYPFEDYDPDPLYCLTRSDCVTFCEHMYAMAFASDWPSFVQTLQRIRYRGGNVGMLTRNHYTEADWDKNNAFLFDDLTRKLGGGKVSVPMKQVVKRAGFFRKFGLGQDIPDEQLDDAYIPKENVPGILAELKGGEFVNIIRGDADSQWAGHTGLIAIAPDGTVDFLHSASPKVREQPFTDFLEKDKRCVGVKLLRLRDDAEDNLRRDLASSRGPTDVSAAGLERAVAARYDAEPADAKPLRLDAVRAMRLSGYRLDYDSPVDPPLQKELERIDAEIGGKLGIPDDDRAVGVLELTSLKLALIRPDKMFYGASVPKIGILLAYFAANPAAATSLDPQTADELGRMIKLSDNEMAAKYGQQVGLEKIRDLLAGKEYRFYDKDHGGGLWYGKHYGVAEPRYGDPLNDHSHGATVRQCLRYYLLMEQGKCVNAAVSRKMKEIFASPRYEHLEDKFVKGLQGHDLSLIRKSGEWEDWFLDTARVQHGDNVYLIAAMAKHAQGAEYLAQVAGAIDFELCIGIEQKPFAHELILHDSAAVFRNGVTSYSTVSESPPGVNLSPIISSESPAVAWFESPILDAARPFNELLVSWNINVPVGQWYVVEARAGRLRDGFWTPWLYFGDGGDDPPRSTAVRECPEGKMHTDFFRSTGDRFDRAQYRLRAGISNLKSDISNAPTSSGVASAGADARLACGDPVRVRRIAVTLSDTTGRISAIPAPDVPAPPPIEKWQRRLPVPFRSQKFHREGLSGLCSPTSLSMVMEYRGVKESTDDVADRVFDNEHKIYGNWPYNVQAAYTFGVEGYLARFSDWASVERCIADDQPLVISIEAGKGELRGAPYGDTDGHLIVIAGFAKDGGVLVNDPAAVTPEAGQLRYERSDLEKCWMKARAGTAYVLLGANEKGKMKNEK